MRLLVHVVVFGAIVVLLGALWPSFGLGRAFPDIVALVAVYLGLTAHDRVAPAAAGAIALGYVADVIMGAPAGSQALVAGAVCVLAHLLQRRLLVRGAVVAGVLSAVVGFASGLATLAVRAYYGAVPAGGGAELGLIAISAVLTGVVGPAVFRICGAVDVRYARSRGQGGLAFEGLGL